MAEEGQEKKRLAVFWRILRWIGLAVLSVLIILGLIFEAPWKVIALLLIFLAACRILPKPAIKWFWVGVGVVVLALIIWVFLPDENGDWRPYTFDEELEALEAKYAIPDEENAAIIYNKLLEEYDQYAFYANLSDEERRKLPMREAWLSKDHPQVAEWLKDHQSTIAILMEASKIGKCRFSISFDTTPNIKRMKRLNVIREWAYLLSTTAANNDIGENRIDEGVGKYITTLRIGRHQWQQPIFVNFLLGVSIEALAIEQIKRFVVAGDATAEHLSAIEEALTEIKHDWSCDLPKILEYEKLSSKDLLGRFYEINQKGKVRLNRDPLAEWIDSWIKHYRKEQMGEQQIREFLEAYGYPTYWHKKLIRAQTLLRWFFLPSNPQKAAKIIDTIFEKYYAMAELNFDWKKQPKEVLMPVTSSVSAWPSFNQRKTIEQLAGISEVRYYRIHDMYLRLIAYKRASQILIAIRRHKNRTGSWPESLEDIKSVAPAEIFIDPINGDSFVYKLTDDGFKLYSKGKNNIDEDGGYQDEADDLLIWPQKSYKAQKRNSDSE